RSLHLHADRRRALARSRQHALTFDFHHAGAAVSVRPVSVRGLVAEMRNVGTEALCDRPDCLARGRFHLLAIELKHNALAAFFHFDVHADRRPNYAAAIGFEGGNNSGKYRITLVSGLEAACPRPQIDASRMHCDSSSSSAVSHTSDSISLRAFSVPDR